MTQSRGGAGIASGALSCAHYMVHSGAQSLGLENVWVTQRTVVVRAKGRRAARSRTADYIIGSYARLTAIKEFVLAAAEADGQKVGRHGSWDIHHLVEGSVYADVHFEDVPYEWMYKRVLPCVLMSAEEHQTYFHGVSRGKESIEMYGVTSGAQAGGAPAERAAKAWASYHYARAKHDVALLAELRGRVEKRAQMLDDLHAYHPVLRAITANVFRRALDRLNESPH